MNFLVYKITNKVDGKAYIGVTTGSIQKRWREHRCAANLGNAKLLYRAMRKHGEAAFSIGVVYEATSEDEMFAVERGLIVQYGTRSRKHGYNLTDGGDGVIGAEPRNGEDNPTSKLTAAAVRFMRDPAMAAVCNDDMRGMLLTKFGVDVSRDCVRDARRGDTWKHMDKECPPVKAGQGKRSSEKRVAAARRNINDPAARAANAIVTSARMKNSRIAAKLSPGAVRAIFLDPRRNGVIEREYGMSSGIARQIKTGRTWSDVTKDLQNG